MPLQQSFLLVLRLLSWLSSLTAKVQYVWACPSAESCGWWPAQRFLMWPLVAYFVLVVFLVATILVVSYLLGPRHSEPATGEPYEGGIVSEGSARVRFSVRYYLIAMFFVVFDLEAVFLFAWAVAAREVGWAGYCEVFLFIGVLFAALVYLWKVGALDLAWKPQPPKTSN